MTQHNLGATLKTLGQKESDTARLEQAIIAFCDALEERTRERLPIQWAMTKNNLGNALWRLGQTESGTGRLEEAVIAFHDALEEFTRERMPLDWAKTQTTSASRLRRSENARAARRGWNRRSLPFASS